MSHKANAEREKETKRKAALMSKVAIGSPVRQVTFKAT